MKPSTARMSEMPGPKAGNVWWGDYHNLQKQRGITQYSVSPFRQNPTAHLFRSYLFNGYRRLSSQFIYWAIPFAIGYSTYAYAKKRDAWQNSKAGHLAGAGH
ncbi:cytochrome b-c1 complex subunit 8 [Amylostereum chailletii]|nr:cytochrome b-c1 complex subunit 8 [Amylostereum chailletii]